MEEFVLTPASFPKYKDSQLKSKYGISLQDYCDMFNTQGGRCAICKTERFNPNVDHDPYKTGRKYGMVRGLLCRRCNRGIGAFEENILYFESAAAYIRERGSGLQESRAARDVTNVTEP